MAGVEVAPADLVSQPMQPGDRVEFIWSVKPEGVGTLRGTVWLYLRFIPKDGGQESKSTLAVKTIEVRVANLLGLSGTSARLLGIAGMVVGSFLGLDNLLPWGWKLVAPLVRPLEWLRNRHIEEKTVLKIVTFTLGPAQ